jgi:hypothetical protein
MEFDMIRDLGPPGWVELRLGSDGRSAPRVLVKFVEREGRAVITRMVLVGEALDSATLRAIPVGRAESVLNPPRFAHLGGLKPKEIPADVMAEMAERNILFPEEFEAIDAALDSFLAKAPAGGAAPATARPRRRQPLVRPDGSDPEGFSRRVAEAYGEAVAKTSQPAKLLADEAGVPVTTVHRWVREARQRGFLPPARKGRAG